MARKTIVIASMLSFALALSGCGEDAPAPPRGEVDPAVSAALGDQILVDPDLSRQNEGNAALTGGIDHALPLPDRSDAAIDAARLEATTMVGGRDAMLALPAPEARGPAAPRATRLSIVSRARNSGAGTACADALTHGFEWAARMPVELPVYPRGAVQEAAGAENCQLRAVHFRTPVPAVDVLAFYHTRARAAGYSSVLSMAGDERVLRGERGTAGFDIHATEDGAGSTSVDLVTYGGG